MRLVYHDRPDQAVMQQIAYLEKVKREEGPAMYWQLVRALLKTDTWFLMQFALKWHWLDEQLIGNRVIRHCATNWGKDLGFLLPRGHGKTLTAQALVIQAIINDPNITILQLSRTQDNADKIGPAISEVLMFNPILQKCFGRKHNKDGFLPSTTAETITWGKKGYVLPYRAPRNDPTLLCTSMGSATAGKHPDIVWIDDPTEEANNTEAGWQAVCDTIGNLWMCVDSGGFFLWTGTRWHDSDPLGRAVAGKMTGKQGKFHFMQESCYVDDDPEGEPTYPRKQRWKTGKESGYTKEMLDRMALERPEFFAAQMRNDPSPSDKADIQVAHINIYTPDQLPKLGFVRTVGVETSGGGMVIWNGLQEHCEKLRISIPFEEIINPRKVGVTKRDRIVAALQPIVNAGRLYAQKWMLGEAMDRDTLGYELRRIGKAAHDDIADALHNAVVHLVQTQKPDPNEDAHLYIACDIAYTEKERSDFTVLLALAVDEQGNYWVVDYDRFQCASPTGMYDRMLEFYRRFDEPKQSRRSATRKFPGAWR